ncbi:MAG: DUF1656 domain-containing protein [Alphaproteobacteria bacterium]
MTKELDIYGVYVPPLVIWGMVSYVLVKIACVILTRKNFYRSDAEQQIFDVSLFVVLISLFSFVF